MTHERPTGEQLATILRQAADDYDRAILYASRHLEAEATQMQHAGYERLRRVAAVISRGGL